MDQKTKQNRRELKVHLVLVATAKIQPYIFGSNRMRENIGASYLVATITGDWAFVKLDKAVDKAHNLENKNGIWQIQDKVRIEEQATRAEVLYEGGGNMLILFRQQEDARSFTRQLSRKVWEKAPGIPLYIIHESNIAWGNDGSIQDAIQAVFASLEQQKTSEAPRQSLPGLGVTQACRSTGLPAVGWSEAIKDSRGQTDASSVYPASAETKAKLDNAQRASKRLEKYLRLSPGYTYPEQFEDLGSSKGEHSYIAVVHADGDGMGRCLTDITRYFKGSNREYITAVRTFSQKLNEAATAALQATIDQLMAALLDDKHGAEEVGQIVLHDHEGENLICIKPDYDKDGKLYVPIRPLVFGGDDVTFVADGRLGLSLATLYLKQFEAKAKELPVVNKDTGQMKIQAGTSSAGVAIVKSHYPFSRAYDLAEDLAKSAKQFHKLFKEQTNSRIPCLDWHFALSGLFGQLSDIRQREYVAEKGGLLHLRPVTVTNTPPKPHRDWSVIEKGVKDFQGRTEEGHKQWGQRRNKAKALREELRRQRGAVSVFLSYYNEGKDLPDAPSDMPLWPTTGWDEGSHIDKDGEEKEIQRCGYFDMLELADWHVPLDKEA